MDLNPLKDALSPARSSLESAVGQVSQCFTIAFNRSSAPHCMGSLSMQ